MFCESHIISVVQLRAILIAHSSSVSRFEFVIRSVNNVKKARHKIANQCENGYGRDNYSDC